MRMVYARRGDGLGTRVLTIIHARMFADWLGLPLQICWPPVEGPFLPAGFLGLGDLDAIIADRHVFRTDAGLEGELVDTDLRGLTLVPLARPKDRLTIPREDFLARHAAADGIFFEQALTMLPDGAVDDVEAQVRAYWRQMNWTPRFRALLDRVPPQTGADTITVHVRRGDIIRLLEEGGVDDMLPVGMVQLLQRFAPLQAYAEAIDRLGRGACRIFVCAEDAESVDWFRARYARVDSSRDIEMSAADRAMLDLAMMARATTIIAPTLSNFSICAAALGGGRLIALPPDVPNAVRELFAILDAGTRPDRRDVEALILSTYAKMLLPAETRVRVGVWKVADATIPSSPPPRPSWFARALGKAGSRFATKQSRGS